MKINDMFHTDEIGRLVKSSNDQPIPPDEPVFILRGRDSQAAEAIEFYISLCNIAGTPEDRLTAMDDVVAKFKAYRESHAVKIPGSTHGK